MKNLKEIEKRINLIKIKLWGLRIDLEAQKEKRGEGVRTTPF